MFRILKDRIYGTKKQAQHSPSLQLMGAKYRRQERILEAKKVNDKDNWKQTPQCVFHHH